MAELFWWFEVVKPSFVNPRSLDSDGTGLSYAGLHSGLEKIKSE